MSNHVIIGTEDGRRVRLSGVFDDAAFEALPIVKQHGYFPSGYHAVHFDGPDDVRYVYALERYPASERDARAVLAGLLAQLDQRRYFLETGGAFVSYHSSQASARKALADHVRRWRNGIFEPRRCTAVADWRDHDRAIKHVPSYVLKAGGNYRGVARIRRSTFGAITPSEVA